MCKDFEIKDYNSLDQCSLDKLNKLWCIAVDYKNECADELSKAFDRIMQIEQAIKNKENNQP